MVIYAQRTVAAVLAEKGIRCNIIPKTPGYEGSEQPTHFAAEGFRQKGITVVIPVAQPILQLTKVMGLVRKEGFKTPSFLQLCSMIGWIGLDRLSEQPWTRDPFRLVFYTLAQMFLGYRPPAKYSEP